MSEAKAAKTKNAEIDMPAVESAAAPSPPAKKLPAKIKMLRMFGFINEETGSNHLWQKGAIVTDPVEIKLIVGRQCTDFEVVR